MESNESLELTDDLGTWSIRVERTAVMPDAHDWKIHLTALQPVDDVAVCVRLPIMDWSRDGFLLMPSAVYDGNRFKSERAPYPPTPQPRELADTEPVIGDIPRLDLSAERSKIDVLAGDLSAPAVGVYLQAQQRGVWLITDAQTNLGTTGLSFVERLDESRGEIIARFPGVRRYKYWLCDTLRTSNDRPATWTTGQSLSI